MKHNIIQIENYLLVGNDNNSKRGCFYCFRTKNLFQDEGEDVLCCNGDMNIIAHLPLNNSPILDGVDLLPPLEDDIIGKPLDNYIRERHNQDECVGFIDGYNKAKEKYMYTGDDIRNGIVKGFLMGMDREHNITEVVEQIIQSLQQPKMPIAFECDMVWVNSYGSEVSSGNYDAKEIKLKTITNSQGKTEWVGTYLY